MDEIRLIPVSSAEAKAFRRRLLSKPRRVGKRWEDTPSLQPDLYVTIESAIREHGGESIPRLSEIIADALLERWTDNARQH